MNEDIKTVVKNELKQRLPEMFPGLTKQAYEEIIDETIASLPKNEEKFEKAMEKAAASISSLAAKTGKEYKALQGNLGSRLAKRQDLRAEAELAMKKDQARESRLKGIFEKNKAERDFSLREQQMAQTQSQFEANMAMREKELLAREAENAPKNIFSSNFIRGAGAGLGGAAVAAMAGGALLSLRGAISKATTNAMRPSFEQSLKIAMSGSDPASEILREKKDKVRAFAETIFNFAPHVASDPNLLKGVLAHVVQGESIDPQTIRSLMELEEKRKNIKTFKPSEISFK